MEKLLGNTKVQVFFSFFFFMLIGCGDEGEGDVKEELRFLLGIFGDM